MSKVSSNSPGSFPTLAAFSEQPAPNKVSRPGWLEIVVRLVVYAIIGFGVGSQLKRIGLDWCYRSRRFQLAYNPGDGGCWHELIGRISWRLNQWQF
jgi:hypothetical protein